MSNEDREWQHFELMQRQLQDREEFMEQPDKETDELEQGMNDHDAHLAQVESKERTIRDAHAARESAKVLDDILRKERKQEQLWRRIYWSCMILLGLIIIYSLWKAL